MLGRKLKEAEADGNPINVWLVNTGWSGGAYGTGARMELTYTRAMIKAALTGALNDVEFHEEAFFGLSIPRRCPDVPNAILNPRDTWRNEEDYDATAKKLADLFNNNFKVFAAEADALVLAAGPR
jgi:phosphoenolpyruvate carboxykinase (ATP)